MPRKSAIVTALGFSILTTVLSAAEGPDFNREVRPILFNNCVACHGPDEENREASCALINVNSQSRRAPLFPANGTTARWIRINDTEDPMPPKKSGHQLSPEQIETLGRWIDSGAKYDKHWSFVKPERGDLPKVSDTDWPSNPIDHYVLARLDAEGLKPSQRATPTL